MEKYWHLIVFAQNMKKVKSSVGLVNLHHMGLQITTYIQWNPRRAALPCSSKKTVFMEDTASL
jgi:hypothetical protein